MARKPKEKLNLNWKASPEWQKKVDAVVALKKRGFGEEAIVAVAQVPGMEVRRILEDEEITKEIAVAGYEGQIDLMKDIIGMGLEALSQALKDIVTDGDVRRSVFKKVSDLAAMKNIVQDLSMLVRLQEDKSTENVHIHNTRSYEDTRLAIQQLKKSDPVFDYPELPPPNERPIIKDG